MHMNWYHWDTNIGHAVACAASVEAARTQLMATLPADDAARVDLEEALKERPTINSGQPFAVVSWHR